MASRSSRYIHGSASAEQARLSKLNGILNPAYIEVVNPRPGDRILDLGSGLGQFSAAMAERTASPRGGTGGVVGIERNPRQLAAALRLRRRSKGRGRLDKLDRLDRLELRRGDVTSLQLAPEEWGSFDLVHTRFLLEHLPDPASIVRTMARAARPGGRVFVSDDDHDVFRLTPEPGGFRTLWKAYVRSYEMLGNDPYVGRKLVALLKNAGLVRVRNGGMFFGGCQGEAHFDDIADNLIGILEGAEETILRQRLIGKRDFSRAMKSLRAWSRHPDAAQWYILSWAEGYVPADRRANVRSSEKVRRGRTS